MSRWYKCISLLTLSLCLLSPAVNSETLEDADIAVRLYQYEKAAAIYHQYATKGRAEAQYQLAVLYRNGTGVKKDYTQSLYWFKQSARQGYARAQYSLATLYEQGHGTTRNLGTAKYWYQLAAKNGYKSAEKRLQALSQVAAQEDSNANLREFIEENNVSAVRQLQGRCTDIDNQDNRGETALMLAARKGNVDIVQIILNCKANQDLENQNGETALFLALEAKRSEAVKLLANSKKRVNKPNQHLITPLMQAALNDDDVSLTVLLKHGANIEAKDKRNLSAYTLAQNKNNKKAMQVLMEYGAHDAIQARRNTVATRTINKSDRPLIAAAKHGHIDLVRTLLANKHNPNEKDETGMTALMHATSRGHVAIVELLCAAQDIDVNMRDQQKNNAVMYAVIQGQLEALKTLIRYNAKIAVLDNDKKDLLTLAVDNQKHAIINYLLRHKSYQGLSKQRLNSLLLTLSLLGDTEGVKIVLRHGAEIHSQDQNGNTALLLASGNGHTQIVKNLLSLLASPNHKNKLGNTALMVAAQNGHQKIVELLLGKGADPSLRNNNKKTAHEIARTNGHAELAKLIEEQASKRGFLGIF